jgi:hypothetical protein
MTDEKKKPKDEVTEEELEDVAGGGASPQGPSLQGPLLNGPLFNGPLLNSPSVQGSSRQVARCIHGLDPSTCPRCS